MPRMERNTCGTARLPTHTGISTWISTNSDSQVAHFGKAESFPGALTNEGTVPLPERLGGLAMAHMVSHHF